MYEYAVAGVQPAREVCGRGVNTKVTAQSNSTASDRVTRLLPQGRRLFWLVMLLFHFGAIRAAWSALFGDSTQADWAIGGLRLFVLVASAAFFTLKMADVACLRLRPGWRSLIASLVVVALLHVNVLDRAAASDSPYAPAPVVVLALVGALVESSTLRRGLLRFVHLALGEQDQDSRARSLSLFRVLHVREPRTPFQIMLVSGLLLPRPPPSR